MVSRRRCLWRLFAGTLLTASGCRSEVRKPGVSADDVRDTPLPISANPVFEQPPSPEDLHGLLNVCVPEFDLGRYPLGYVLHCLRFWGRQAVFPQVEFIHPEINELGLGEVFFRCATDNEYFKRYASYELEELFVESEHGVKVECMADSGWSSRFGAAHIGNFVEAYAQMGIPSSAPVVTANGVSHSVLDVIRDDAARVKYEYELEWLTMGLARYLRTKSWGNVEGIEITFDKLVETLLSREGDACMGTHVPYSLAVVYQLTDTFELISEENLSKIELYFSYLSTHLTDTQRADGSWQFGKETEKSVNFKGMTSVVDRMYFTGHLLEWMAIAPDNLRPEPSVLQSACDFLRKILQALASAISSDWHIYSPTTHAVRAVLLCYGIEPKSNDLIENGEIQQ